MTVAVILASLFPTASAVAGSEAMQCYLDF